MALCSIPVTISVDGDLDLLNPVVLDMSYSHQPGWHSTHFNEPAPQVDGSILQVNTILSIYVDVATRSRVFSLAHSDLGRQREPVIPIQLVERRHQRSFQR